TTVISGILLKKYFPNSPHLIIAMSMGILITLILNKLVGSEVTQISNVGSLPSTLPPLSVPDLSLDVLKQLAMPALAITLFALTEAVSISRSLAERAGQRINVNQEFIAQGLSNIAGSFFSSYVATGSFNRSGLNQQAGAKTPIAAALSGFFLIGIVMVVGPYANFIPKATMAGLLFLVAWGLIDLVAIKHIIETSRRETMILLVTLLGALFVDLEVSIFAGVILSLFFYLKKVAHPQIVSRMIDPNLPN
ncbi:MAG: SulP family inorganic anion transporter, partial [Proteobacteria bacterium]|nr:SulP family inorganic anion transporter [Pseudomonadota bacterium]